MKSLACILAGAGLMLTPALAAPSFAPVLQDHMVLQRGEPVTLWGETRKKETVTVRWKGQEKQAKVAEGRWSVTFPPSEADAMGSSITATDSTGSTTLNDVLVGDLWLASEQSNMEWTVAQSAPLPGEWKLNNPQVRLLRGFGHLHGLPGAYSEELYSGKSYEWNWRVCNPSALRDFSAVAIGFALQLQQSTGVPIGIICNAKGGSSMEAWIPRDVINKKKTYAGLRGDKWLNSPDFDAWSRGRAKQNLKLMLEQGRTRLRHPFAPAYQYEVAVAPLAPAWLRSGLRLKGVIWYQGESNADNPDIALNATKMKDLIGAWRKAFRSEELPFLMVQLPRINDPKRPHWAAFREAQQRVANELPAVGLICTIDLGSTNANVHPPQKAPVAQRLAELARAQVYGEEGLPTYPRITGARTAAGQLELRFSQRVTTADGQAPRGFAIGSPGNIHEAEARLAADGMSVRLPQPRGKATWYYIPGTAANPNLVGAAGGLPLFPARGK